ncbi:MAG: LamB/YcsF family protein, partial [Pedobacter sp.]
MIRTDLNCDMGEGFGVFNIGNDEAIMPYISSVNIACGFHAGDPSVMRNTVAHAINHDLLIGAHPGFADLQGFGRREIKLSGTEIYDMVVYQIGALMAVVSAQGGKLHHVKPHGALYNMAARDSEMAKHIAQAIFDVDDSLVLYGLSGSQLILAGKALGLKVANEVFADRTYQSDGSLTSRSNPNSLISDHKKAINQVIKMVKEKVVVAENGEVINIEPDT